MVLMVVEEVRVVVVCNRRARRSGRHRQTEALENERLATSLVGTSSVSSTGLWMFFVGDTATGNGGPRETSEV